ncbi:hypothetical protein CLV78_101664 [Aliiruegeria haliotis]|uniref:Uncharacterized protein n=1 Tax=Aliiruegeria haliotis TaxID=1280846 RepID=A0A2T0RZH2_9RHOB|nr:hypothetical protein [Aliiruegeria haliotis]PRY26565.1 hypothetical protein CLV78_101664 [Aliiruegeria haliotis]
MADPERNTGGFWSFLPFGLTVLGGATGVFYITFGTQNGNPVFGVALGAVAGWLLALVLRHLARRAGWDS